MVLLAGLDRQASTFVLGQTQPSHSPRTKSNMRERAMAMTDRYGEKATDGAAPGNYEAL